MKFSVFDVHNLSRLLYLVWSYWLYPSGPSVLWYINCFVLYIFQLEDEIEKLNSHKLRNRQYTLNLSRIMVRAEDFSSRVMLLHLLQTGEPACRRLFLDYHGLKVLWSWMADLGFTHEHTALKIEVCILIFVGCRTVWAAERHRRKPHVREEEIGLEWDTIVSWSKLSFVQGYRQKVGKIVDRILIMCIVLVPAGIL